MSGSSITVSWCRYDETSGRVSLVIPDLGPGDEGDYQCRADNPYGDSTCTITVSSGQLGYADLDTSRRVINICPTKSWNALKFQPACFSYKIQILKSVKRWNYQN